ncbi:MAG: alpha-glycosidase [Clostridiales bacterium]|nr:alpha-glycosidase [Clostridiales bacterium]
MNKHAIFHIPDTPYAYGKDINTLTVRIKVAKDDVNVCKVFYKDRYDESNPFEFKELEITAETDLFTFFQGDISLFRNRYKYFFELVDNDGNQYIYDERGIRVGNAGSFDITPFQYAYIAKGDLYEESQWLQESVAYQIFVDRFNNGDESINPKGTMKWGDVNLTFKSRFGGDIQGIIDKLDYLKDLGVTLIYLTPIFQSNTAHKYNITDYYAIDSEFGDLEKVKELVNKCHEKGLRIVLDAVFNHSGSDFFAFQDLLKNQEKSKYVDWYFVDSFPVTESRNTYYTFGDNHRNMPKLNTNNEEVREYLLKVSEYWIKEVGIDGWRLDVCDEIDHDFWRAFKKRVKKANKDAVIIGEIMHEASSFLRGDQMDSIMNYPFKLAMVDFFGRNSISAEEFSSVLALNRSLYMDSISRQMWNLIGSHDTPRFLTECGEDIDKMKLAIEFQFTYIGVPYIYYGDEVGMTGAQDPYSRKCMIWEKERQNQEIYNCYKRMIKFRKDNKVLIYGDYKILYCKDNVLVFSRSYEDEKMIIAINNNSHNYYLQLNIDGKFKDIGNLNPREFKILE